MIKSKSYMNHLKYKIDQRIKFAYMHIFKGNNCIAMSKILKDNK